MFRRDSIKKYVRTPVRSNKKVLASVVQQIVQQIPEVQQTPVVQQIQEVQVLPKEVILDKIQDVVTNIIIPEFKKCYAGTDYTPNGMIDHGARVVQNSGNCVGQTADCNNGAWTFGECKYKQLCNKLGKCLATPEDNPNNGTGMIQWDANGARGQLWEFM